MKKIILLTLSALVLLSINAVAQEFDDVYFDPSVDEKYSSNEDLSSADEYVEEEEYSDDYVTNDVDNYDYQYASRIRRFNRPYTGFGYYSGCYVDRYYYDPYSPGTSIYVFNNNRMRYNMWGNAYGYNPYGINNPYGFNPYYNSMGYYNPYSNNFGYYDPFNPYGRNNFGWGGNNWNANNFYLANSSPNGQSYYYGPRRSGASNASGSSPSQLARKKRGTVANAGGVGEEPVRGGNVRARGELDAANETVESGRSARTSKTSRNSDVSTNARTRNATSPRNVPSSRSSSSRNSYSSKSSSRPSVSPSRNSNSGSSYNRSSRSSRSSSASPSRSSRSSSNYRSSSPSRSSASPSRSSSSRSSSARSSSSRSSSARSSSSSRSSSSKSSSSRSSSRRGN